ncbi:hypothetical protein [Longimicrobium terrae]|uniref:Ferritin-like domain-containing protein n=1 Tax=Longimicrobium terrae TaxID=1639882 RepID=A0A841H0A3_9BACT|nr:hypothetical protein [Longimicrobium terrae]MBB4636960.1 hypothetical protein [Longimicrobium terrae]MBB6071432.1 hypothetical protein [Longimicrobium terrae]NNC31347.1 hypothetical protein [Longimicrobium terrae]
MTHRVVLLAEIGLAHFHPTPECPRYLTALRNATAEELAPFSTDVYADAYRVALENRPWTARSLMLNAQREGEDARRLWSMAVRAGDSAERELLKRHAVDQSDHARAFLTILDLAFPGVVPAAFREQLASLSPGYGLDQEPAAPDDAPDQKAPTLDDFIHINLAQLRNASLQILLRPSLTSHCPPENVPGATEVMDSILADELTHVARTAVVIERQSREEALHEFAQRFQGCLRGFIDLTSEEPIDRGYHLRFGNYP